MMDSIPYIFNTEAMKKLLTNKFVVFIGDSVMRSVYKDFVLLLQEDRMLSNSELKKKGELSFLGDELIEGGKKVEMTNGKNYTEVRQCCHPYFLIRFYFVTRVYSPYMETIVADLVTGHPPDIIIINSGLWDITRYGAQSMVQFEMNLQKLCQQLKRLLVPDTLVMWTTSMPVAQSVHGGFLIDEISFMSEVLRLDILSANYYASQVVADYGFEVVDLHYAFRRLTDNRADDGIHWNGIVHRAVTNLLLWHICDAWHVQFPRSHGLSLSEPQQQVPSLLRPNGFDSTSFRRDSYDRSSREHGQRPVTRQRNVDFSTSEFGELCNDRVSCSEEVWTNSSQSWKTGSSRIRGFGSDLTNRGRPRQRMVAKRGRSNLRNYRQRPY